MWWFLLIGILTVFLFSQISRVINNARNEVNETIGEIVLASRFPSGRLSVAEMQARNIHPYFCPSEYKMVWVAEPAVNEVCPWCNGNLVPFD